MSSTSWSATLPGGNLGAAEQSSRGTGNGRAGWPTPAAVARGRRCGASQARAVQRLPVVVLREQDSGFRASPPCRCG